MDSTQNTEVGCQNIPFEYAEVIVQINNQEVDRVFHYSVPEGLKVRADVGCRVRVPFGVREIEGYIVGFSEPTIEHSRIKPISAVLDDYPVFAPITLALAKWMQKKYYTTLAACLRCVAPRYTEDRGQKAEDRGRISEVMARPSLVLTEEQEIAVNTILSSVPCPLPSAWLLHGVTGSGKTEVYLRVIEAALEQGKQAIMLVPEISLTPQAEDAFKARFGEKVTVTHSRLTPKERRTRWQAAREGRSSVMVGPRSAIFTPFSNLGVIVVDEEHEKSYISETSPKYSVTEVAGKLAELTGAALVLGSATPLVETYYKAAKGEIGLLELKNRVNDRFPAVHVSDMRLELAAGNKSIFSRELMERMNEGINSGRQTILFLNRRGHSTFVSCRSCGFVCGCEVCSVNYTYHVQTGLMLCHYCGAKEIPPAVCPVCEKQYIRYFGVGTQRVEEEVKRLFPGVSVLRMDADTTGKKGGHENILRAFGEGRAQVLVGTQMIAKGLDFPNVSLVGIVDADMAINIGDFRSHEAAFQLITQVSGRSGRGEHPGSVVIQTYNPRHYVIEYAANADYAGFYEEELRVRKTTNYPPFSDAFTVTASAPDEKRLIIFLNDLSRVMTRYNRKGFFEIIGPAPHPVPKVNRMYRWRLLIKAVGCGEEILVQFIFHCLNKFNERRESDEIKISVDRA